MRNVLIVLVVLLTSCDAVVFDKSEARSRQPTTEWGWVSNDTFALVLNDTTFMTVDTNENFTLGINANAEGFNSIAGGSYTSASNNFSLAFGHATEATGHTSTALGSFAHAMGDNSFAAGSNVVASGVGSTALGTDNQALGDFSFSAGDGNICSGTSSITLGFGNWSEGENATCIGSNNHSIGAAALSFGLGNETVGEHAISIGYLVNSNGDNTITIGSGTSSARLVNNRAGSIGFGVDSIEPSVYIEQEGLILKSPSGNLFLLGVDDSGNLSTSPIVRKALLVDDMPFGMSSTEEMNR